MRDVEGVIRSNTRDLMYLYTETEVLGRLLVTHSAKNPIEPLHTSPGAWLSLRDVEIVIRINTRDLMYLCTETEGLGRLLVTHSAKDPIEPLHKFARCLIELERCRRSNKEQKYEIDWLV